MAVIIGTPAHLFGVCKPKRLRGWPKGKIRLRMRNNDFMYAYVRNEEGITKYGVIEKNDNWYPGALQARNHTPK